MGGHPGLMVSVAEGVCTGAAAGCWAAALQAKIRQANTLGVKIYVILEDFS